MIRPTTVDFESLPIRPRPYYPPVPVGVSIKPWGGKAIYYAWGHPSKNTCSWAQARKALGAVWDSGAPLLFHNAKFDVDLAEVHMELPQPSWDRIHDTMYLVFLEDPHQLELGLKPSADRLLGIPPEERDAVVAWLCEHQPLWWTGLRLSDKPASPHYAGAYVAYAPGDLVGAYANGDVVRTEKLFTVLHERIVKRGMEAAYDRERKLMPILLHLERQGIRVDKDRLGLDITTYGMVHDRLTEWVQGRLQSPSLNVDSGPALVEAMLSAGVADAALLGVTPKTGRPKTDKESLKRGVRDAQLLAVLKYRTQLGTCLHTFMRPWMETATASNGLIHTVWNQTKMERGEDTAGTRTGRLSSNPNFQNIPKKFEPVFTDEAPAPFDLPPLPLVRGYVIPWKPKEVLVDRDYSQQELRILAHYEDGQLLQSYKANPWMDVHDLARELINRLLHKDFPRKHIKNTGFGLLYGMGVGKLAVKNETTVDLAREVQQAYLSIFPGLKRMQYDMKLRAASKKPIRTWGGREYYCEEAKIIEGKLRQFDYKLLNVLIQGSAADCTKEAILNYWEAKPKGHTLYLTVHDEVLVSAPERELRSAHKILREAMESVPFDVPMLSEGTWGRDWAHLQDFDKEGREVVHA
ncbi:hypothetical protein KGP36_02410 [Patescibacteria group bacterium]|nr:hypothetical protein [Patescibacteria group bacterium]